MVAGRPDWTKFEITITKAMGAIHGQTDQSGPRLYGDMVGVLWNQRQFAAAIQLERFWNKLLARSSFSLYCAYSIDVFGKDFRVPPLEGLLRAHTHLMPCEPDGNLEAAIDSAMDETLGANANSVRRLIQSNDQSSWAVMPKAETTILWLRTNLPDEAAQIIERARDIYRQSHPATATPSRPI